MSELLGHLLTILEDEGGRLLLDTTIRKFSRMINRKVEERTKHAKELGDAERLAHEINRLEETIDSLRLEVQHIARTAPRWSSADEEVSEPAFEQFVDDALDASVASRIESKRRTLGRLIARRLTVETGSQAEAALRRSIQMVRDSSEAQLRLLAAITLVRFLPAEAPQFTSRDEAERWLQKRFGPVPIDLAAQLDWPETDFEALASIGAVRMDLDSAAARDFIGGSASAIDNWLQVHGVSVYDGLEGEWGSQESKFAYRRRFPTIVAIEQLASGRRRTPENPMPGRRLDQIILSPTGATLGSAVLNQLVGDRDEEP